MIHAKVDNRPKPTPAHIFERCQNDRTFVIKLEEITERAPTMVVKIIAVKKEQGILAPFWEFKFSLCEQPTHSSQDTLSLDEVIALAGRPDAGAVFEMCREIKGTPPTEFGSLVGRMFESNL
jgi:hypothetical protein